MKKKICFIVLLFTILLGICPKKGVSASEDFPKMVEGAGYNLLNPDDITISDGKYKMSSYCPGNVAKGLSLYIEPGYYNESNVINAFVSFYVDGKLIEKNMAYKKYGKLLALNFHETLRSEGYTDNDFYVNVKEFNLKVENPSEAKYHISITEAHASTGETCKYVTHYKYHSTKEYYPYNSGQGTYLVTFDTHKLSLDTIRASVCMFDSYGSMRDLELDEDMYTPFYDDVGTHTVIFYTNDKSYGPPQKEVNIQVVKRKVFQGSSSHNIKIKRTALANTHEAEIKKILADSKMYKYGDDVITDYRFQDETFENKKFQMGRITFGVDCYAENIKVGTFNLTVDIIDDQDVEILYPIRNLTYTTINKMTQDDILEYIKTYLKQNGVDYEKLSINSNPYLGNENKEGTYELEFSYETKGVTKTEKLSINVVSDLLFNALFIDLPIETTTLNHLTENNILDFISNLLINKDYTNLNIIANDYLGNEEKEGSYNVVYEYDLDGETQKEYLKVNVINDEVIENNNNILNKENNSYMLIGITSILVILVTITLTCAIKKRKNMVK